MARTRGKPWTSRDVDRLVELWGNSTVPEIAAELGRTEAAIAVRASINGLSGNNISKSPKARSSSRKMRNCMCCAKQFNSSGPGHRICSSCKRSSAWQVSDFAVIL